MNERGVRISFRMPLAGRRSAEPAEILKVTPIAQQSLALPQRGVGLFQFKCAAVECHHFGNAADFDLADIRTVT
jgi:hypothetical protein